MADLGAGAHWGAVYRHGRMPVGRTGGLGVAAADLEFPGTLCARLAPADALRIV